MHFKAQEVIIILCACLCVILLYAPYAGSAGGDAGGQSGENGYLIFKVEPKDAKAVVLQGDKEIASFNGGADRYALPPGKYTIRLEAKDRKKLELPFEIKAQKDTDLQTLKLPFPNGTILWTFECKGAVYNTLVSGEKVFIAKDWGIIACLDLYNGDVLWEKKLFDARELKWRCDFFISLSLDGKRIFAASNNSVLYCLNTEKGKLLWQYQYTSRLRNEKSWGNISITSSAESLFFHINGELICIDSVSGKQRWSKTGAEMYSGYADGFIYVGNNTNNTFRNVVCSEIRQYDERTGKIKNIFHLPKTKKNMRMLCSLSKAFAPVIYNKLLYITHRDDSKNLYCFDTETGKLKWTYSPNEDILSMMTFSEDGLLYLLSVNQQHHVFLNCLDAVSGEKKWRQAVKGNWHDVMSNLIAIGENVYFAFGTDLYCMDAKTGEEKWKKAIGIRCASGLEFISVSRDKLLISIDIKADVLTTFCIQIDDTGSGDWITLNGNPANTNTKVPPGGLPSVEKKKK